MATATADDTTPKIPDYAGSTKSCDMGAPVTGRTGVISSGEEQVAEKNPSSSCSSEGCCTEDFVATIDEDDGTIVDSSTTSGGERSEDIDNDDDVGTTVNDAEHRSSGGVVGIVGDSRYDFSSSGSSRPLGQHCRVCFAEGCSAGDLRTCNYCEHRTCVGCYSAWIKAQVTMGKADITCPSCDVSIPPHDLAEFVSAETLRKLDYYKSRREHSRNPHAVWCAEPACRELLTTALPAKKKSKEFELSCTRCETKTCRKCNSVAHEGRCKKPRLAHTGTVKNVFWKRFHARKCPECHIWIEKDGGCSEMECTNCNMNFCFRCGTTYYRINLAGRSIDGCRCIRVRKNSLRFARAGVFAISFPFLVVALGIGIPAAALLYYASSNDRREVADRVFEEFFKHSNLGGSDTNSFRNHIQHLVDRGLSDGTSTDSDTLYSNTISDGDRDTNVGHNTSSIITANSNNIKEDDVTEEDIKPQAQKRNMPEDSDEDAIVEAISKEVDKKNGLLLPQQPQSQSHNIFTKELDEFLQHI